MKISENMNAEFMYLKIICLFIKYSLLSAM